MIQTIAQARDEIISLFKSVWDVQAPNVPLYYWDGTKNAPEPTEDSNDNPASWARITVRHTEGGQSALINVNGTRRYTYKGLVTVQIFTPARTGLTAADALTMIAVDTFAGAATTGGIWFRNATPKEVGHDGPWFQTNVTADFEYDRVK